MTGLYRYVPLFFVVMVGIFLRLIAIQHTDPTNVIEQPLLDDSFYYMTLGRNLADGRGALVDDQHLTTGFQPLWGAMSILPALLTDDLFTLVHLFQWMGVLVSAGACVLVYVLTLEVVGVIESPSSEQASEERTNRLSQMMALLNAGLWYWHPHHVAYSINGMETILSTCATLFMLLIFVRLYRQPARRYALIFGVSIGMAFLARVDTSMLIIWLVIAIVVFPPIRGERIMTIIRVGAMGVVVISPWMMFTLAQGKFILPESGAAVRAHTLYTGQTDQLPPSLSLTAALSGEPAFATYYGQKMTQFITELARQLYPFAVGIPQPDQDSIVRQDINIRIVKINLTQGTFFAFIGYMLTGWVASLTRSRMIIALWLVMTLWLITAILAYSFVIISWWFYERYTLPIAEVTSILILCIIYAFLLRFDTTKRWFEVTSTLLITSIILFTQNNALFTDRYRWIFDPTINQTAPRAGFYEAAMWLNYNIPDDARVGAFQSGVIVYYANAHIINLDGKVNADAHRAMTDGNMWGYICEQKLEYIVDWPVMIYFLLIQRSQNWQDDNLSQIALIDGWINPIQINRVNSERCPQSNHRNP